MEQRSVLQQTTRPKEDHTTTTYRYRWMQHFFTEDVTPDNYPIIDLQRRAVWIGLALILQSINEIDYQWYMPYIKPFGSLIPFALFIGSFIAMYMAFRPVPLQKRAQQVQKHPRRWQKVILILTILLTIAGSIELGRGIIMCFLPPQFTNDGTSLDTNAAILLSQGRNPYTDSNILDLIQIFPIHPEWTTPLQRGQFSAYVDYPTNSELQSVLDTDRKLGTAPEFESKVSYPALSFLTLLPFVWLHDYNVLPFYMCSYLILIAIALKCARPEMRLWVLLLTMANVPMWVSSIGGNLDVFYILLVVVAWLQREQRWKSALFLGLALASKQPSWFLLPFYAILMIRQYSWKEAFYRLSIAGSVALACNLPFILWNPQAWLAGILAPVADPMFPMGVGIVNLSVSHLLPFLPKWMYSAIEGLGMLLSWVWYWRICKKQPEAAMVLAVMPLFFAWRSLSSYFYCAAYPLFVLLVARVSMSTQPMREEKRPSTPAFIVDTRRNESVLPNLRIPTGVHALVTGRFFQHLATPTRYDLPGLSGADMQPCIESMLQERPYQSSS